MEDINKKSTFNWPVGGSDDGQNARGKQPRHDGFETLNSVTKVVLQVIRSRAPRSPSPVVEFSCGSSFLIFLGS
jgi:hypothetical protein